MLVKQLGVREYIPKSSILSVNELNSRIKNLLTKEKYKDFWVEGEVSNVRIRPSTSFFTLKDDKSKINCVCFDSYLFKSLSLEDGDNVTVKGDLDFYTPRGEVNIKVSKVKLSGEGLLHKKYVKLKKELSQKGYFDKKAKQDIPKHIQTIGVITSKDGAALQDFISTVKRRYPYITIKVAHSSVQGVKASKEIISQLQRLENMCDVIALIRGGGSLEDLWCFNNKDLVETIHNTKTPIVCGIGHETDTTLADLASDLRCPTPTACAEVLTVSKEEVFVQLDYLLERLKTIQKRNYALLIEELEELQAKMQSQLFNNLHALQKNLEMVEYKLKANNPKNMLEKGFALIKQDDKVVTSKDDMTDDEVTIMFKDGEVKR